MERPFYWAFALIATGFALLLAELFLPTGGILFVLSVCAIVFGIAITFLYGNDPTLGLVTLGVVFVAFPLLGRFALRYSSRTRWGKRLILNGPDEDATVASMPVLVELEQLRGRYGRAISALRPSGIVDFDGRRVDTITQGIMVEPGEWVRCIDVRAGRVIVRPAPKPDIGTLENAELD